MDNSFQKDESKLDLLREEYTKEINESKQNLLLAITDCCRQVSDYGESARRASFNEVIDAILRFDNLNEKQGKLDSLWLQHSMDFRHLAPSNGITIKLEYANKCIEKLKKTVDSLQYSIHQELANIIKTIKDCPGGREKAGDFQRIVCDLFEWLFIDRLKRRDDLKRTSDGSQIKDGVFEVEDGYIPEGDFGCPFQYLYLECKNYKNQKPKSKDIFQLFGYTLFATNTGIFQDIPLCLLISRKNPDSKDLIWDQRWRIYDKFDKRLILFLDDKDLSRMVENKQDNDNLGKVIKDKIREIRDNMVKSP